MKARDFIVRGSTPSMQDWLDQRGMGSPCRPGYGPVTVATVWAENTRALTRKEITSPAQRVMQREADIRQRDREYQLGLLYSDRDTLDTGEHFQRRPVPRQKSRGMREDSELLRLAQQHLQSGLIRAISKSAKRRHIAHALKMKEKSNG